jgi:hypothetical protein
MGSKKGTSIEGLTLPFILRLFVAERAPNRRYYHTKPHDRGGGAKSFPIVTVPFGPYFSPRIALRHEAAYLGETPYDGPNPGRRR